MGFIAGSALCKETWRQQSLKTESGAGGHSVTMSYTQTRQTMSKDHSTSIKDLLITEHIGLLL